jgi:positive regulator of sigma E activity
MEHEIEVQEDRAKVIEVFADGVLIEIQKSGSCKTCAISGVCGGPNRSFTHRIKTDLPLEKGDIIEISISSGVKLLSSFIVFILPIFFMILFYFLAKFLFELSENFAILLSFSSLLLSGVAIYLLDKKFARKIHFEIIGKVKK